MYHARGDVKVAVSNLMDRGGRYGESKWASLQAGEKVLKAAISLSGATYGHTHDLDKLCRALTDTGIQFDAARQIAAIQCTPGIRYGDEACSREEALAAHHASLELVNILSAAGARFTPGMGG
ncbi:HEPN domain-containing protein [Qipengyuania sp. XHP0207]|uniref:HEPN domain-containing protein n=1 Tax=Qipengyuania sp. XHP0207 TaxID=3038078 RepID=UPI00241C6EA1|nr:HEPN domain-containing protein [Qipengyuania sp. XHP0207]MDG5748549.1 HEPN domain-containing protein [Qipengyuania sp. XHP0207]